VRSQACLPARRPDQKQRREHRERGDREVDRRAPAHGAEREVERDLGDERAEEAEQRPAAARDLDAHAARGGGAVAWGRRPQDAAEAHEERGPDGGDEGARRHVEEGQKTGVAARPARDREERDGEENRRGEKQEAQDRQLRQDEPSDCSQEFHL
jgi:hypothetical protein